MENLNGSFAAKPTEESGKIGDASLSEVSGIVMPIRYVHRPYEEIESSSDGVIPEVLTSL
ncbi:hypothetical protein D918_05070 [Trichuris suis]|nr:hypothetical protein D918_05070 [Trichuris suis]